MKKFLTIAILMLAGSLFAQAEGERITFKSIRPQFTSVTMDSATEKVVYVAFPTTRWDQVTIDTVALTTASPAYQRQQVLATGDVYIQILPEVHNTEESDSLYAWIKPYGYFYEKEAWYESEDLTYLVFDTPGVYAQAGVDYLDWTAGEAYGVSLSNELWATGGFTIHFNQKTYDNAGADTKIYVAVWIVR